MTSLEKDQRNISNSIDGSYDGNCVFSCRTGEWRNIKREVTKGGKSWRMEGKRWQKATDQKLCTAVKEETERPMSIWDVCILNSTITQHPPVKLLVASNTWWERPVFFLNSNLTANKTILIDCNRAVWIDGQVLPPLHARGQLSSLEACIQAMISSQSSNC